MYAERNASRDFSTTGEHKVSVNSTVVTAQWIVGKRQMLCHVHPYGPETVCRGERPSDKYMYIYREVLCCKLTNNVAVIFVVVAASVKCFSFIYGVLS